MHRHPITKEGPVCFNCSLLGHKVHQCPQNGPYGGSGDGGYNGPYGGGGCGPFGGGNGRQWAAAMDPMEGGGALVVGQTLSTFTTITELPMLKSTVEPRILTFLTSELKF